MRNIKDVKKADVNGEILNYVESILGHEDSEERIELYSKGVLFEKKGLGFHTGVENRPNEDRFITSDVDIKIKYDKKYSWINEKEVETTQALKIMNYADGEDIDVFEEGAFGKILLELTEPDKKEL